MKGSENNDPYEIRDGKVVTKTNHHGGILGGLSSGMPVVFRTAMKPTPSIALQQDSVDLARMEPAKLTVKGRHDPCIVPRAVPCIEAAVAIAVFDALSEWRS
jgi:chorismate synthase